MPKYRVLRGTYRREDGTRAESGDVVDISEEKRSRLPAESLEEVETDSEETEEDGSDVAPTPSEQAGDATVETELSDDASADDGADIAPSPDDSEAEVESAGALPDDWEMLQAMAVVYDGSEVKGNSSQEEIEECFGDFSDTEVASLKQKAEEHLYDEPADADSS